MYLKVPYKSEQKHISEQAKLATWKKEEKVQENKNTEKEKKNKMGDSSSYLLGDRSSPRSPSS